MRITCGNPRGGGRIGIHMKNLIKIDYENIISIKNLFESWQEFIKGKKDKKDVAEFALNLSGNIIDLHHALKNKTYKHDGYKAFNISDPKPRNIHKASVRDRLLHHAIHRVLYPYFDQLFIYDSYSCRLNKGTHRAINRFRFFGTKVSKNNTKQCYILKCDIKKFFASINHEILINILNEYIQDKDIVWLLERVIESFNTIGKPNTGLPLGNLTSQLLVNVYMNKFDQFVKHKLKIKYYIRYADDFVIFDSDKNILLNLMPKISNFLQKKLKLEFHPDKVFIKTIYSGLDFLGWVHFPNHRVLRTSTKRRVTKALKESENVNVLTSYCGLLKHGNQFAIKQEIENKIQNLLKK